jgi:4-amino-4-deoxy-L-arabinose transferase-like glycosyltransferase
MKKFLNDKLIVCLLLFLTFFGFILRINNSYTTTHDEAWEVDEAMQISKNKPFYQAGSHPFIFPLILYLIIKTFGMNAFTIHLPNLILGTLLIPLVYFFGKRIYNKQVGLMAAGIISVLPSLVSYSRSILLDLPLTFFSLLTLFLFYLAIKKRKKSYNIFIASGIVLGLCCLFKETGILNLIPLSFLLYKNKNEKNIFGFKLTVIICFSIFSIWLLNPSGMSYVIDLFFGTSPATVHIPVSEMIMLKFINSDYSIYNNIYILFAKVWAIPVVFSLIYLIFNRKMEDEYLLSFIITFFIMFTFVIHTKAAFGRFLLPIVPPLILISSNYSLKMIRKYNILKPLLPILLLFLFWISITTNIMGWEYDQYWVGYVKPVFLPSNYNPISDEQGVSQAAVWIKENYGPGRTIISFYPRQASAFADGKVSVFASDPKEIKSEFIIISNYARYDSVPYANVDTFDPKYWNNSYEIVYNYSFLNKTVVLVFKNKTIIP